MKTDLASSRSLLVLTLSTSLAAPLATTSAHAQVIGFADLHAHPASHLAFGHSQGLCVEGIFHGDPGVVHDPSATPSDVAARIQSDLRPCKPSSHSTCGFTDIVQQETRALVLDMTEQFAPHHPFGAPSFDSWPSSDSVLHQQMHIAWIYDAFERGGLRLLVASVTDNELLERLYQREGRCELGGFEPKPEFGFYSAMEQLEYLHFVDEKNDWMQIVTTPGEARDAIDAGRLPVILALEMDALTVEQIRYLVESYKVRSVIPIHLTDNSIGGAAVYADLFNALTGWQNDQFFSVVDDQTVDARLGCPQRLKQELVMPPLEPLCPYLPEGCCSMAPVDLSEEECATLGYGDPNSALGHRNARGLTGVHGEDGTKAILELMAMEGLLVDVAHMSWRSMDEALALVEEYDYPLINSHTGVREGCVGDVHASERDLTHEHAARIGRLEGVVGLGTIGEPPKKRLAYSRAWPAQRFTDHLEAWRIYRQPYDRPPEIGGTRLEALSVRVKTGYDGLVACTDTEARLTLNTTRGAITRVLNHDGSGNEIPIHAGGLHVVPWDLHASALGAVRVEEIKDFELELVEGPGCADVWDLQAIAVEYVVDGGAPRGLLVERVGSPYRRLRAADPKVSFDLTPHARADDAFLSRRVGSLRIKAEMGKDAFDSDVVLVLSRKDGGRPWRMTLDDIVGDSSFSQTPGASGDGYWVFDPAWKPLLYGEIEAVWLESGDKLHGDTTSDHGDVAALFVEWHDADVGVFRPLANFWGSRLRGEPSFRIDSALNTTQVFHGLDDEIPLGTRVRAVGGTITTGADDAEGNPIDIALLHVDGSEVVLTNVNRGLAWAPGTEIIRKEFLPATILSQEVMAIEVRKVETGWSHEIDNWNVDGIVIEQLGDPALPWIEEFHELFNAMMLLHGDEPGIALGTDFNGLSPQMPFVDTTGMDLSGKLDAIPGGLGGTRDDVSSGRRFTLEQDGLAHFGMLSDFGDVIAHKDSLAGSTLYQSAEATIQTWEKAIAASARVREGAVVGSPVELDACAP